MNVTSLSFPYGESIQWFSPENLADQPQMPLKEWLLATGSLTKKLKSCCTQFDVTVLGEGHHSPMAGEFPSVPQVWVREVLLNLDETPWVFARTLIPEALLDEKRVEFTGLGDRPLGELLFSSMEFIPGRIEVAKFETCSRLAQLAQSLSQPVSHSLWGRRRYFSYGEHELIVSEIFLPAAEQAICAGL